MIAKLIVHGPTRDEAIERMSAALAAARIEGIHTNIDFLRRTVASEAFRAGLVHTGFVDAHKASLLAP
jgi:3-methylcrotonyl-CoA carboxylase alpha subunit